MSAILNNVNILANTDKLDFNTRDLVSTTEIVVACLIFAVALAASVYCIIHSAAGIGIAIPIILILPLAVFAADILESRKLERTTSQIIELYELPKVQAEKVAKSLKNAKEGEKLVSEPFSLEVDGSPRSAITTVAKDGTINILTGDTMVPLEKVGEKS